MKSMKTYDFIKQYDDVKNYIPSKNKEPTVLKLPKCINNKYLDIFERNQVQESNQHFFATLKDIKILCSDNGISGCSFLTNNGIYLEDLNPYWSESINESSHISYRIRDLFPVSFIGQKWSGHNFFHFVHTCLPKLSFYLNETHPHNYIHNSTRKQFVKEFLQLAGVNLNNVFCLDESSILSVEKLNIVSPIGYGVNPNRESCNLIRKLFIKYFLEGKKRIYVTRKNARYRTVVNESELLEILIPKGFEVVEAEHLSVHSQIEIFSQAEVVIAPHGSGLTNLVFCNPNTKVLELFAGTYLGLCYWLVADSCDLDYYYLISEGYIDSNSNYWYSNGSKDITINIDEFEETLKLMEI